MPKAVVISQPRYLPVVNYLQRLKNADLFVFLDNVQRQYLGVENRNRILVNGKRKWLTVPVSSSRLELIHRAKIAGSKWVEDHKRKIYEAYKKAPYFDPSYIDRYYEGVYEVLENTDYSYADTLIHLVLNACRIFGFEPNYVRASDLGVPQIKGVENLFNILRAVNADIYISGSNGREYGVKEFMEERGIRVLFNDYRHPVYKQFNSEEFVPWLCFFDTLFNVGYETCKEYIYAELDLFEE